MGPPQESEGSTLSTTRRIVAAFWPGLSTPAAGLTPDERVAFDAYGRYTLQVHGPRFLAFFAVAAVIWWPLDLAVFAPGDPARRAFNGLRLSALLILLGGAWLGPRLPAYTRRPEAVVTGVALLAMASTSWWLGGIEGFGGRWFQYLTILPFLSVPFASLGVLRTPALVATFFALWVPFAAACPPGTLATPQHAVGVSFLLFTTLLALAMGHVVHALARDNFVSRLRLSRQEELLRDLNENLEARVAEKALALRRLARHLERLREDERKWMAREIHDELGQELTAMRYAVALAKLSAGPGAGDALGEVQALLDRTRATMRRILAALRPRVLDELGLVAGLDWLTKDLSSRAGLVIHLEVEPPDLQLEGDGATVVFRIVQEALSNVVKHAEAHEAWVRLAIADRRLTLVIADDGKGLPGDVDGRAALDGRRTDVQPGHGLGLLGIRERADAIGGAAELGPRAGGGTELRVVVPYPIFPAEGEVPP